MIDGHLGREVDAKQFLQVPATIDDWRPERQRLDVLPPRRRQVREARAEPEAQERDPWRRRMLAKGLDRGVDVGESGLDGRFIERSAAVAIAGVVEPENRMPTARELARETDPDPVRPQFLFSERMAEDEGRGGGAVVRSVIHAIQLPCAAIKEKRGLAHQRRDGAQSSWRLPLMNLTHAEAAATLPAVKYRETLAGSHCATALDPTKAANASA